MSCSSPVLEAKGIRHGYPGPGRNGAGSGGDNGILPVIDTIGLCIREGEFVSLVGPSGCGKTTLLRILAGLLHPDEGSVLDRGVPVSGPDWRRSLVFQQPHLFPWLTVEQNIAFGPRNRKVPRGVYGPKVEKLIKLIGLQDFRRALPGQLSGGMKQRVCLARGLANEPHILLLDEPLGALDALTREQMQEELLTIWKRTGCTVVLVTHSVEEALYLSNRVIVLSRRPARITAEFPAGFGASANGNGGSGASGSGDSGNGGSGRAVKSGPEFLKLKERVLEYLWEPAGESGSPRTVGVSGSLGTPGTIVAAEPEGAEHG